MQNVKISHLECLNKIYDQYIIAVMRNIRYFCDYIQL